ncbi:MAG: beta-lactamase family protein [Proteobacteria bacterium]|nr:beta-lactamase family protein [Pseudomonadota bacterium]
MASGICGRASAASVRHNGSIAAGQWCTGRSRTHSSRRSGRLRARFWSPAHEQAVTTDTIFRIYSMTKPIVSVAVMMLWEDSAFKLDDPIGLYLPEFNSVRVAVYDETRGDIVETVAPKRPITIRDLLRHTSGMTYDIFGAMTPVKQQYLDANLALDTFDGDLQQWMYDVRFPTAWQHSPTYLDLHACSSLDYS